MTTIVYEHYFLKDAKFICKKICHVINITNSRKWRKWWVRMKQSLTACSPIFLKDCMTLLNKAYCETHSPDPGDWWDGGAWNTLCASPFIANTCILTRLTPESLKSVPVFIKHLTLNHYLITNYSTRGPTGVYTNACNFRLYSVSRRKTISKLLLLLFFSSPPAQSL